MVNRSERMTRRDLLRGVGVLAAASLISCSGEKNESAFGDSQLRTGMTLPSWRRGELRSEEGQNALREIAALGINSITLVPYGYQKNTEATEIYKDPQRTSSDAEVEDIIRRAKDAYGLRVVLKPHIDTDSTNWRGEIGKNFSPGERRKWFESYKKFLIPYAEMAERTGVDLFSIGVELKEMSQWDEEWQSVVKVSRDIYGGELTYSANYDEILNWWELVDKIGIDEYTERSSDINELRTSWQETRKTYTDLSKKYNAKGIILTEFGLTSTPGALNKPYEWGKTTQIDQDEQANGYKVALESLSGTVVEEVIFWNWYPYIFDPAKDLGYSPRGKKAEKVLRDFNNKR